MKAVYDLSCSSPKWDFIIALCLMERERRKRGEEDLDVLIAPGPNHGFRVEPMYPIEPERRMEMLRNIVLPLTSLVPSVRRVECLTHRLGLRGVYGFGSRLVGLKRHLMLLHDPEGRCIRIPRHAEPGLITLTLRECDYYPDRNSDLKAWLCAAHDLTKRGYKVVIVRDTAMADEPLDGFETAPEASRNVLARADLYARAEANAFVVNGPFALAQLANLSCVAFWKSGADHHASSLGYYKANGIRSGDQYPNSPPWQRLEWRGDLDHGIIVEAVEVIREASAMRKAA